MTEKPDDAGQFLPPRTFPGDAPWVGTVRPCANDDLHYRHTWERDGENFLCFGVQPHGPETREEWKARTFHQHYGIGPERAQDLIGARVARTPSRRRLTATTRGAGKTVLTETADDLNRRIEAGREAAQRLQAFTERMKDALPGAREIGDEVVVRLDGRDDDE